MLRPLPEVKSPEWGFVIFSFLAVLAEMVARVRLDGYLLAPVGFPLELV